MCTTMPDQASVVIIASDKEPMTFGLLPVSAKGEQTRRRCVDTVLKSPDDFCPWQTAPCVEQSNYIVQPRSLVGLALPLQAAVESVSQAR